MKDRQGRFMALNRRNCEVSNIRDEWDVIGLKSSDIFPAAYANTYMSLDREVRETGHPILNRISEFPTDQSDNFMISNLYLLKNAVGETIETIHVYIIASKFDIEGDRYKRMRAVTDHIVSHLQDDVQLETLASIAGCRSVHSNATLQALSTFHLEGTSPSPD
jgi:hypothetical protein